MFLYGNMGLFYFVLCSFVVKADGFNVDVKDTVTIGGSVDSGSYFGYSLGIGVINGSGDRRILVGAPRSNDPAMPDVSRPGAVFACTSPTRGNSTCRKLDIDSTTGFDTVNFGGKVVNLWHGKNDSWLGGSIDVLTSGTFKVFATCAQKWYNEISSIFFMQGICYEIPLDFNMTNVKKLPPLASVSHTVKLIAETGSYVYNYGFGGLGTSVHYTKDGANLLLGATGLLDWIGGFVDLDGDNVKIMQNNINNTDVIRPYLGYSATSGSYFSDGLIYFVFGAPRKEMRGMVLFFKAGEAQYTLQSPAKILEGSLENQNLPANSYYGATLCTVDINNDNTDDLLVAAPLYTPLANNVFTGEIEIGIVFVYLGSGTSMGFQSTPQTLKGTKPYGRFGTAIANLGDINSDSFADIAIGAPYEDNLKGAVYIFNGYIMGVWPKHSQRILASDLDTGFRGFGIAITSGKDINSDNINDMVVGSYLSDEVVIMFGQPVIAVHAQMNIIDSNGTITNFIEMGEKKKESVIVPSPVSMNPSYTAPLHGLKLLPTIFRSYYDQKLIHLSKQAQTRFRVTISLDVGKGDQTRLVFTQSNERSITSVIQLFSDSLRCTNAAEILKTSTGDLTSEIVVLGDYSIEEINCPGLNVSATVNLFNGAYPADPILQLGKQLQFSKDCPNNVCKTNLILQTEAKYENIDGYFIIGNQDLVVDIKITKTGDASYGSIFLMIFPKHLSYKNKEYIRGETDVSCSPFDSSTKDSAIDIKKEESALACMFGNPMAKDTGVSFRLYMKVSVSVANDDASMVLRMHVETLSEELDPTDNNQSLTINLRHNLEALFTAISKNEEIYLEDNQRDCKMEISYELHNKGPSVLQSAVINVSFPQIQKSGKALLYLYKTEIRCGQTCDAKCIFKQDHITPVIYSYFNGRLITQMKKPETTLPDFQNTDCRKQACSLLTCTLTNIPPQTSAMVVFRFIADKDIEDVFVDGKSIALVSAAAVQISKTNLISNRTEFSQQLRTSIRKRASVHEARLWWIIPVSVFSGDVLLAIIILILWKIGFFKRKWRDELEKRKLRLLESGKKVNNEKRRDSYTGSEVGIIDNEMTPGNN